MHEQFAVATGTSVRVFNKPRYWISKQIAIGKTHTFGRGIRLITHSLRYGLCPKVENRELSILVLTRVANGTNSCVGVPG